MKIGISTFGCDHGRSGIGAYILSLVHKIPKTKHKIQLFGHELDKYTYTSGVERITYAGISIRDTAFAEKKWHILSFNTFAKKNKYDIVLFPAGLSPMPLEFKIPVVAVIQKAIRNTDSLSGNLFAKRMLSEVCGIICPSNYLKNNLLEFGIKEEKIRVIHNGIDSHLFYPHDIQNRDTLLIKPFAIQRPYIIYASRIVHPEKSHVQLITGFSQFKKRTGAPHRLVITGAAGKGAEKVHQAILRTAFSSDIVVTGYFPHQNLPELYSAADLCIFPAAGEGIGLPVIEAMACGIPTASARSGALPEIAGDCTLYFDYTQPDQIADAIEKLIYNPAGKNNTYREDLVKNGIEWVKQYRWNNTARETIAYLESFQ